jgi:hypothetical protein
MCGVEVILIVLTLQNELLRTALSNDLAIGWSKEIRQRELIAEIDAIFSKCRLKHEQVQG